MLAGLNEKRGEPSREGEEGFASGGWFAGASFARLLKGESEVPIGTSLSVAEVEAAAPKVGVCEELGLEPKVKEVDAGVDLEKMEVF